MATPEQPEEPGLGDLFGQLVDDGKGYARAEIGYYRAIVAAKLSDIGAALWMGVVALILAHAAIIALLVGLVLSLVPLIGPGWATAIVVVGVLGIAGLLGWLAWSHVKRVTGSMP